MSDALLAWLWPKFPEIHLEIRGSGRFLDSGNFRGNKGVWGAVSCGAEIGRNRALGPLGTPQNLEMPMRASENLCVFQVQNVQIIEKIAHQEDQEDAKPDPYWD